jgi:bacterioferritin (cytochrome b1)
MLASEEDSHAALVRARMGGQRQTPQIPARQGLQSIWKDLADFSMREKTTPDQVDVYRHALEMERQSIDLYSKLQAESTEDTELFGFLVEQEEEHFRILEQIVELVNRPNEWVEAAEFGLRKEY